MNDFLRPCSCVHPLEEDCEKCVEETAVKPKAESCCGEGAKKAPPATQAPSAEKKG